MGEEEKKEAVKPILADLRPVFGERRWPPRACHLFANVVIFRDGKIFLALSEDRKDKRIFTPYGGEVGYLNMEEFNEAAAREVKEETGGRVNPDPKDLTLLDLKISYPTKENDPYGGVILVIASYVYPLKPGDLEPSVEEQIPEEGCNIVEIWKGTLPKLWEDVANEKVNLFPNFMETLKKLEKWVKKNL